MTHVLDLERARHALAQVRQVCPKAQAEFLQLIKGFPAVILCNGLGQALLMVKSRGKLEPAIYRAVESWLCRSERGAPYPGTSNIITAITEGDRLQYMQAQAEALHYVRWLKQFAVAFMESDEEEGTGS